ncbi:MAG: hypothetical protein DMD38_14515 [Gemmatimonadetes bacterium]|nr:MAG: hypothetical protein DMD38_14515 [Gemmatimonadota bacterium]
MPASARDLDLRQHHGVETPEHVDVRFELAGVGSRVAAGLLDLLLVWLGLMLLWVGGGAIVSDIVPHGTASGWLTAGLILLTFCLVWGYFTLFEALNGGRTPGKQALGIRVVMDTGRSLTPQAAVVRNLVRFIDCYFPAVPFAPAILSIALHPSNKRLGDMAAGTIVVRDRPTDWTLGATVGAPGHDSTGEAVETGPPELAEEEFRLLDRFLGRLNELTPDVQARITADLVRRFEPRIPRRMPDLQGYLVSVSRTYQVDPRVIAYLERVVTAGHNALYRARGKQRTPLPHYILRDFPAAVVQSWQYVLLAFLLFSIPAAVGYVMIRERPALAEELVSPVMVARAEAAAENQAEGRGYAETNKEERPQVAALIITNNITVSFGTFVGGLTAGVLTTWLLFANGMMFGLALGLFRNYQALNYLLTFVLGHGVLELTAIFISAGAGFRLAKAMIAPGDRTRRDALVVEGRIAARMIGAVVTLLAIAGTIEGLLSTSSAPAAWKYGVSAASAVFLVLYLANGYLEARGAPTRS